MSSFFFLNVRIIVPTVLILITSTYAAAQSSITTPDTPSVDPVQMRIERARALAATHQLEAAASELESLRASTNDLAMRNVTTLMLLGIYLEEANYVRAQALLEEAFQARNAQKDDSVRTYFAMAGQMINGVRSHLARYRSFGINLGDSDLPPEARSDLDRVRNLLERMVAQAREITRNQAKAYDALALQEDVVSIRTTVARDNEDRDKWQLEYAAARERLASAQIQVASLNRPAALGNQASVNDSSVTTPRSDTPASTAQNGGQPGSSTKTEEAPVSVGLLNGRETKRVAPTYPAAAKSNGVFGAVRVYVSIDQQGTLSVIGSEGPGLLKGAAEAAARNWSFPPVVIDGAPKRVTGFIDFDFQL
ncbi:MAG: energy transducer TonB [Pyrinomonadaceae bacterium]